jgi:2,4-dienoyl-CoA reductase-like NADH-dependent reductase (Old Yellow Enzyme family)
MSDRSSSAATSEAQLLLFSPITVGPLTLKNRFLTLPLGLSRYVDSSGAPTERMIEMYRTRALGGAAMVTLEAAYIEPYQPTRPGLLGFYSDNLIAPYTILTDALHSAGSLVSIEIFDRWHADFLT